MMKIPIRLLILILGLVTLFIKASNGYSHVEKFNKYILEESQEFFKNMLSTKGLVENFNRVSDSVQVWKDTLSGTRCANPRECKKNNKVLIKQESEDETEVTLSPSAKEIQNIQRQLQKLDDFEEALDSMPLEEHIIKSNRKNVEKYRNTLMDSLHHHRVKRYLQNTGVVEDEYKIYEAVEDGEYLVWIRSCSDGSTVSTFDNPIFFCNGFRVTNAGYNLYNGQAGYTCTTDLYENRIGCWCRKTQSGGQCGANLETKCNITIYDPDFTQPCRDSSSDSRYYSYSIPGFDPCHWVDRNQKIDITFTLNCYQESYKDIKEWWGISYDTITTPATNFSYIIDDPNQRLVLGNSTKFDIEFRLLNWRWLSEYISFTREITTMDMLYGAQNATVTIDLSKIPKDKESDYIMSGRIHMYVSDPSYDFKVENYGYFFELKGYTEPSPEIDVLYIIMVVFICLGVLIFLGIVAYFYIRKRIKYNKILKVADE